MKSRLVREPVVVGFVTAAVALAAAFGWNVSNDIVENVIDVASLAVILAQVVRTRGKVTPV